MSEHTLQLNITEADINALNPAAYNPRKWSEEKTKQLTDSIRSFGLVDPIIVNGAMSRKNTVIGGHFRLKVAKDLGYTKVPVVYIDIADIEREKELNLRLNKNLGEWDLDLLAEFDETILADVGFDTTELDDIFTGDGKSSSEFDLQQELDKLNIENIDAKPGDIYQLDESRLMVGDSTLEEDVAKLMNGEKADMCLTDPPYIADYKGGIRHGSPVTTKGPKRSRRYLETEEIPENFTELWMANIAAAANDNFSIIVYESWKNVRAIWNEMEKHFTVKNMLVWHIPQKNDGYAAKHKFFNKYDIAIVGAKGSVEFNDGDETDGLQETYRTALFGVSGKPYWEEYDGPNKLRPTDHIEFNTDDQKNSGQDIIFGTKPLDILIPYIKVLTKRGDLIVEPFSGSGSTLIAATRMNRRCYGMEKSPVYAEVIMRRWEQETGLKRKLVERATDENEQPKD